MEELKNKKKTVLYFTRNREEAFEIADRICIVANCELKEFGDKKKIIEDPQNVYSVIALKNKNNILTCDIVNDQLIDRMDEIAGLKKDEILRDRTSLYVYIPEDAVIAGNSNTFKVKETNLIGDRYLHTLTNSMTIISDKPTNEISFDIDMSKVMCFDIPTGSRIK